MRQVLVVTATLALAAGLAGCGGSGPSPVAAAATKSANAGGVKVQIDVRFSVGGIAGGVVTGAGKFSRNAGDLDIDMSNLLQFLNLPIGSGGGVREIYREENGEAVVYVKFPFLADQMPAGKRWLRFDLEQAGAGLGLDLNKLLGEAGTNPTDTLDMLRAARSVDKVGPDIVGGVNVTQYHTTVDLHKALALHGVSETTVKSLIDAGAPAQLPVDVWIGNDDGLVHQLRIKQEGSAGGKRVSTLTTMTLTSWGSHVTEAAPPKAQVFDATALTSGNRKA